MEADGLGAGNARERAEPGEGARGIALSKRPTAAATSASGSLGASRAAAANSRRAETRRPSRCRATPYRIFAWGPPPRGARERGELLRGRQARNRSGGWKDGTKAAGPARAPGEAGRRRAPRTPCRAERGARRASCDGPASSPPQKGEPEVEQRRASCAGARGELLERAERAVGQAEIAAPAWAWSEW